MQPVCSANGTVSMARLHVDTIRLPLIEASIRGIPLFILSFHVAYISDRRVIKAAINAWPFPLPLSCRPTRQRYTSTGLEYRGRGVGYVKPPN